MHYRFALVACLLAGCADDSPAGATFDLDVTFADGGWDAHVDVASDSTLQDGNTADVDDAGDVCPGGFGCPCEALAECHSGWCVPSDAGKVCTVPCIDECPGDWVCKGLPNAGTDLIFLCAPEHTATCEVGTTRPCLSQNELGSCPGTELCTADGWTACDAPAASTETCNALDDDCDGATDEDFAGLGTACDGDDDDLCSNGLVACHGAGTTCVDDVQSDELCNGKDDDCDAAVDEGFPDLDADLSADCVDDDDDADGDPDATDCAPADPAIFTGASEACDGVDQDCDGAPDNGFEDLDEDGLSDCVDDDRDGDGVENAKDNCPDDANTDQKDLEGDGLGDACDSDDDGDLTPDSEDNCPLVANAGQADFDADGLGDACDADDDEDGALDVQDCNPFNASVLPGAAEVCNGVDDNCNGLVDEGSPDNDQDKLADCVDFDDDNDGVLDDDDCAPLNAAMGAGAADVCNGVDDDCDGVTDNGFPDDDDDGLASCVDTDDDGDGVPDAADNCPLSPNPSQQSADGDAVGDACDTDDDNDGALDDDDCAPADAQVFPGQKEACNAADDDCDGVADNGFANTDGDELADCVDDDDDGDGVPDVSDDCPKVPNEDQANSDTDLLGDACDPDDDNDLTPDASDCAPANPLVHPGQTEACNGVDDDCDQATDEGFPDSDGDGVPDCLSDDDDGDSVPDSLDNCPITANASQKNADDDLLGDACDVDDDGDGVVDADDCLPLDKSVYPGADELCNGKDDDCDSLVDEGFVDTDGTGDADCVDNDDDQDGVLDVQDNCPLVANAGQLNSDTDLLGDACDPDDDNDLTPDASDCAPLNAAIHPGAGETCNGEDDDCNGALDEGCACTVKTFGDHTYRLCNDLRTWHQARTFCASLGAHMAAITSAAENAFIVDATGAIDSSTKWWVGGNDIASEGSFVWESGEGFGYTNWHSGEPNNTGDEDCVQLWRFEDGTWNDEPCGTAFHYVCED